MAYPVSVSVEGPFGHVDALGVTNYETYLTGNVGGGLKWFSTRHFGLRGDYRLFMVKNKDTAPRFFGTRRGTVIASREG
jgi:hypothetical protein